MIIKKATFVDLWESFYDRHPIYAISAILKQQGVEVDYIFSKNQKTLLNDLKKNPTDLVLYSAFSSHVDNFINFDKEVKKILPNSFSIIGGPGANDKESHLTLSKSGINATCIGEGDIVIADFLKTQGECSFNLVRAENLVKQQVFHKYAELDNLPFPDRDVVYKKDKLRALMPSKQFMAGRGCPYKCTYCHNHLEHEIFKGSGRSVRLKSVDYLIEEIKQVKKKYPLKTIVFQDDIFYLNKKWGEEFCEKFPREVGIPFTCNVRSNLIDEDVVRSLKHGGCETIAWAIESGDPEIRNKILKRNVTDEGILAAADLFNKYKIKHRINNVIGIPGESFDQMLKTLDLNIKAKPYLSSAHIFIPFKGLQLTDYAISSGYLSPSEVQTLPNTYADNTVLNFNAEDKVRIKKLMLLFPILTRFPFLYNNKFLFKIFFRLPISILGFLYEPVHLFFWSRMYKVSSGVGIKIRIIRRYFSYGA